MHFLCVFFTCETRELREEGKKWQQREKKKIVPPTKRTTN